ncbi:MAG: DUF167 domain-containing protein [Myxococcota bacterium]
MHVHGEDLLVDVLVAPRASRSRIVDVHDNRLKIQITAPPTEGKANAALVELLARTLGVAKVQVDVVGGASSRRKTVRLAGVPRHVAMLRLTPPKSGA